MKWDVLRLVTLAAAAGHVVEGSIYPVQSVLEARDVELYIKDTPMFSRSDSPFWFGGLSEPYISIKGKLDFGPEDPGEGTTVLRVIHAWSQVPPQKIEDHENYENCNNVPDAGDFDGYEIQTVEGSGSAVVEVDLIFSVNATAWHVTILTNCRGSDMDIDLEFEYKNPYGYLNGWAFGIMPMNGFLCLLYGVLAVVYIFKTVRYRQHVLNVQFAIIAVIVMGFIERLTWFLTYLEMNSSGGRACCPVRGDLTFSLALAVFKRSSSALLLLAVCLGFGVVKPKLERSTSLKILALGAFYTLASLNLEIEKVEDISKNGRQTDPLYMSSLVVSICDVLILFWIYYAISQILTELREGKQIAKLQLYQSLARSLFIWVMVWFVFTFMELLVFQGKLGVSWRYWFVLVSFWDIFFLGILLQICYLWAPSPLTSQYAFSQQLPTTEDLDEFDQIGLEMGAPETASSEFVIGEDDDDDDDDDELSLDGIEPSTNHNSNSNGNSRSDKITLD